MSASSPAWCLKVDVDTHDGMRDGVPVLLDVFKKFNLRATFFLAFGPDNSGKAIWNVSRQKGFLKKMIRTGAPKLYGWRTVLSGTLLPARMIAVKFPDIVRRIADEGHEVGIHAWDHRLWQDHLERLSFHKIAEQYSRACDAFESILGRRPSAAAAPAWLMTPVSLKAQDELGFLYASDMRGGRPGYPVLAGYRSNTLQIPTTQPCLEELINLGERNLNACLNRLLSAGEGVNPIVLPLHAEVEGGPYRGFLENLLSGIRARGGKVQLLEQVARDLLSAPSRPPPIPAELGPQAGRAGRVLRPRPVVS